MIITPKTTLKACFAASALLALSACNTMMGDRDRNMGEMNHQGMAGMNHMMGAMLTGAAEAPGPGDPTGTGNFKYNFKMNASQLCYELAVQGIAAPTAAHIHEGAVGVEGGVVATLRTPMLGRKTDTCMNIDPTLARRIMANPASFYVNVHNAPYPNGAVRGQLMMMRNM